MLTVFPCEHIADNLHLHFYTVHNEPTNWLGENGRDFVTHSKIATFETFAEHFQTCNSQNLVLFCWQFVAVTMMISN